MNPNNANTSERRNPPFIRTNFNFDKLEDEQSITQNENL